MRLRNRPASRPTSPITIVVASLAALALAVALTWFAIVVPRGVPGVSYYELDAQFGNVGNVGVGSEVRIGGRRVGQVTDATMREGRGSLRLQLQPGTGPLRSDTRARIRLRGVLGGKFVEIVPGRRGERLPNGATLPARQTSTSEELLDVVQALDPVTRVRLQSTLRGLGEGFLGRGRDVNDMLRAAPELFGNTELWTSAVLAREDAAARFIPSAEAAAAAFDPVREDLARGFRPGARALQALADRRVELRRALEEAPPALAALQAGADASTPLLAEAAGLARTVTDFTGPAPAALREASVLLREAREPLRRSDPLLRLVARSVPPTLLFLERVDPVAEPASRALHNSLPPLVELGRRPCELFTFARNWRSMLGFGVAPDNGDPTGDLDDDAGLGQLNSLRIVAVVPKTPESLSVDAHTEYRPGVNPYPGPCEAPGERLR